MRYSITTPRPTRTQAERREATVTKLIDATIEAIHEVGYAAASTKEICRRAGVSEGGMFRHFPSRLDLVCAAAEEVGERQSRQTLSRLSRKWPDDPVDAAIRALRRASRDPSNAVWFELLIAARTNAELRTRLAPVIERNLAGLAELASHAPGIRDFPADIRTVALLSVLSIVDGETILQTVSPQPELERQRTQLLRRFASLAERTR